jgi:hypothetical protein
VVAVVFYLNESPLLCLTTGVVGLAGVVMLYTKMMGKAKAICCPQCVCVSAAVAFIEWDGSRQAFEIISPSYALAFMAANERKLVNLSPQALQLLETHGYGQLAGGEQAARRYST